MTSHVGGFGRFLFQGPSAKPRVSACIRCCCVPPASRSFAAWEALASAVHAIHAVRDAIAEALTPHQRAVLVAIALDDVPIDVLAERLGTTRGALYTSLRHARRKLRARPAQHGLALDPSCERDTG